MKKHYVFHVCLKSFLKYKVHTKLKAYCPTVPWNQGPVGCPVASQAHDHKLNRFPVKVMWTPWPEAHYYFYFPQLSLSLSGRKENKVKKTSLAWIV